MPLYLGCLKILQNQNFLSSYQTKQKQEIKIIPYPLFQPSVLLAPNFGDCTTDVYPSFKSTLMQAIIWKINTST